ncbi:MAG: peptidylprolyl isomerase [Candidatus Binatus sp.]
MSPRGAARRARARSDVAMALMASLGIVLAGAVSGCSLDLLKPGAFDMFKQPAASSTATASSATASSRPALSETGNAPWAAKAAPTPAAATQSDETPPPPPAPVASDEPPEPSTPALDRVVASVDGEPITMREVKDFAAQRGQPIETDDFASSDAAKVVVKELIGEKLLEQEVKKYDDKVDDAQIDKYIQQLRQDKHMSDVEFRAQLQASGISYDDLRKRARLDIEKAMMIDQEVRAKVDVPDADIKAFYDAHKEDFTITKERLKLAQILIELPPNPTAAQVSAAQKKADMIRARAAKGDDFGDLARVYSDDESKSNGGELGWFAPSDVMDQILAAVRPLKPGEISAPIRTSHGIHIVKLEEHQVPGVQPLADVKTLIRAHLVDEQSGAQLQKWVDSDLVKQHYVETMY